MNSHKRKEILFQNFMSNEKSAKSLHVLSFNLTRIFLFRYFTSLVLCLTEGKLYAEFTNNLSIDVETLQSTIGDDRFIVFEEGAR